MCVQHTFPSWSRLILTSTRNQRHHKEDVIVGSLIGSVCALLTYLMYWPNPFATSTFAGGLAGRARVVYTDDRHGQTLRRTDGFELTRIEDELESV
jgi:diacylglycerol diphosphate phosphatase/phosphatidate phosphatase